MKYVLLKVKKPRHLTVAIDETNFTSNKGNY